MAKLLLIKATSHADNRQPGDIVGIFRDDQRIQKHSAEVFDVVIVSDAVVLNSKPPTKTIMTKTGTMCWIDGTGVVREIMVKPRFSQRYDMLTASIKDNYSRHIENITAKAVSDKDLISVEDRLSD